MQNTPEAPLQPAPPSIPTLKTPARILARHRVYRRNHPDKVKAWHRADYQRHRDRVIARAVRQRKEKREANCVLPEESKLYQNDSLRERHLGITAFVVCRECGWKGRRLHRHVRKLHPLTLDAYSEKWNYPPLVADEVVLRARMRRKLWHDEDPEHHKFFHTKDGENKRHVLVPGEAVPARANKPATPAQRRRWKEQGQRLAGKPRHDRRGKKLIGPNRQSGAWVDAPAVDDANYVEPRLSGKLESEIAQEVGRTVGAVQSVLRRVGVPNRNFLPFHGAPLTPARIAALANDFGISRKQFCGLAGLSYFYITQRTREAHKHRSLSATLAAKAIPRIATLIHTHCYSEARSGKRVRAFLGSELQEIQRLQPVFLRTLSALRAAVSEGQIDSTPSTILNWICAKCREEKANEKRTHADIHDFRALLLSWRSLKELIQKDTTFLRARRGSDWMTCELLAAEFATNGYRIGQVVDGKVAPLQPQSLAIAIQARSEQSGDTSKAPRKSRKSDNQRKNYELAKAVHELLSKCAEGLQTRRDAQTRWPTERTRWESALRQAGFTAQVDVDALISSKTAAGAAERMVANRKRLTFRRVQNAYSACKESF